jgi:maleate isomerase
VTHYTDDVQGRIVDNLSKDGPRCIAEVHFGIEDNFSFWTVPQDQIEKALNDVSAHKPDAVIVLCTNLAGAPLAQRVEDRTGMPVIDSITLTMWGALARVGRSTEGLAPWGPRLARLQHPFLSLAEVAQ